MNGLHDSEMENSPTKEQREAHARTARILDPGLPVVAGWQPTEGEALPPNKREQVRRFEDGIQVMVVKYGDGIDSVELESDLRRLFGPINCKGS